MNWYLEVLRNYATFSGRSRRMEYWMFALINAIIGLAISSIEILAGGPGIIGVLYGLAVFIPGIAVTVRRLHDINRSGWWLLILLIPLIGAVIILIFMIFDSQSNMNKYGNNPKFSTVHAVT